MRAELVQSVVLALEGERSGRRGGSSESTALAKALSERLPENWRQQSLSSASAYLLHADSDEEADFSAMLDDATEDELAQTALLDDDLDMSEEGSGGNTSLASSARSSDSPHVSIGQTVMTSSGGGSPSPVLGLKGSEGGQLAVPVTAVNSRLAAMVTRRNSKLSLNTRLATNSTPPSNSLGTGSNSSVRATQCMHVSSAVISCRCCRVGEQGDRVRV